jgi:ammonium transporter Rh
MQKPFLLLFVFAIFISACSFIPQPSANPSENIVLKPLATATLLPSPTPTTVPATVAPVPTTDPTFFRDDFIETLDAQWSWLREDPQNWSLTTVPGSLQIKVGSGYVPAHTNSNLLLRSAPVGNFQIETQIVFRPRQNFQFAGLIIYESDSNFIQAGRQYCNSIGCIGEGLYMDYYQKGAVVKPNFGQTYRSINPISLRLSRRETTYTFEASTDGKVWFVIGNHISDLNPLQIGLVSGQRMKGNDLPAAFDYFEVRSLP